MTTPAQSVPNSKSEIVNSKSAKLYFCRESSTNRPFFVQTNPILSAFYPPSVWRAGGFKTLYFTKDYGTTAPPAAPENEPKRTQFFARQEPSKPKRTQTNPIYRGGASGEAGTNPIFVPLVPFIVYKYLQRLAI